MRRQVELYIKANTEEYSRVDLFDFEDINLNNSIKDVRDIAKVFTEFSQEFKVPASKRNNSIFKHYYNWDIVDGYDGRIKVPAIIKINGIDYKQGRLTLTGASLKKGAVNSYSVVFYGETVSLKQLFSNDELKDLNTSYLNQFEFTYNNAFVKTAFKNGYNLSGGSHVENTGTTAGDFCAPFISCEDYYFYDSTVPAPNPEEGASASRNVNIAEVSESTTPKGISFSDLKFGIRVYHVIKAIEQKYGITFSTDFFSTTNADFYELYLFLSKESGGYAEDGATVTSNLSDFTKDSGIELRPLVTWNQGLAGRNKKQQYYDITYTITTTFPSSRYNLTVTDISNGVEFLKTNGGGLSSTFTFTVKSSPNAVLEEITRNLQFKVQGENVSSFGQSASIVRKTVTYTGWTPTTLTETSVYSLSNQQVKFSVTGNMPKIKVLDFMTSLFKTFNLTAYYENGIIKVKTLNDYYDNGQSIDLTKYIDNDVTNINRSTLYSEINFEFQKPSTFAVLNSNEITGDEFGNERMNNLSQDTDIFNTLAFDGGTYNVKNKFEKVMYERMSDQSGGSNTNVGWGWLVNNNQNTVLTKPILFYGKKQDLSLEPSGNSPSVLLWDNSDTPRTYDTTTVTKYIRASNTRSYYNVNVLVEAQSINFGSEVDEFHQVENSTSLFQTYYKEYIEDIYNERSRLIKMKAILPVSVILKLTLDDEVLVNNRIYGINKIKLNINTGKADLELMSRTESKLS
jgi:hypothetical protein